MLYRRYRDADPPLDLSHFSNFSIDGKSPRVQFFILDSVEEIRGEEQSDVLYLFRETVSANVGAYALQITIVFCDKGRIFKKIEKIRNRKVDASCPYYCASSMSDRGYYYCESSVFVLCLPLLLRV